MTKEKPTGLRERKKAKTRAAIQEHALRLFRQQGYAETTVQEIAAAAEVSPATFFRYFPTKEETVLFDRLDPVMIDLFRSQPAEFGPTEALRGTVRDSITLMSEEEWELESQRQELILNAPELRARMMDQLYDSIDLLAELAAERIGRSPDDFAVRAWAGAVVGIVMATYRATGNTHLHEFLALLDQAITHLEAGVPLHTQ
ncbi:TetR family transcriptional regulator [Kribbella orskensis]|uniref:TetR family transcriptional regulator n=1 Tax=Kribbella orskensis TaxID=2512216 RepID=A0ABY2BMI8_9ACTN|nr:MULTISPECIES: TetR family transcriptional regulator [Kribbella]TCN40100.1 TetR family transcriptional regulator [Kribbella sp. VKM Ac-2500]TCO22720.1 TetR family transcriptional regulator [Kribbella orskensis]